MFSLLDRFEDFALSDRFEDLDPFHFRSSFKSGWSSRCGGWQIFDSGISTIRDTGFGSGSKLNPGRRSAPAAPRPPGHAPAAPNPPSSSSSSASTSTRGSSAVPTYEQIRDSCIQQRRLWEDPDFPTQDSSLFYKHPPASVGGGITWKRPGEICSHPQMFSNGQRRNAVNQGILGDCWLLAAIAALATHDRMLYNVVPQDQSFDKNYAGVFRFRFWSYGKWIEVLIDDRLPTKNGQLIYLHSKEKNEFWSALVEKAYAKLSGCYEALSGGLTIEAMTDFTGGIGARHDLRDKTTHVDLFQIMLKASKNGSLMGCSIDASEHTREDELSNGLLIGHAYSITDVRMINVRTSGRSGQIPMVRVRNPWGDEHEWKGDWSDDSKSWAYVSEEEKREMGLVKDHDGEFWISFKDFSNNFQRLEICFLGPDGLALDLYGGAEPKHPVRWESSLEDGFWHRSINAGGCQNYPQTFWTNPQYHVSIEHADHGDKDGNGMLIIGVMQKDRRKIRKLGKDNLCIGYCIFELTSDPNAGTLNADYFRRHNPVAKSHEYTDLREIAAVHKLPPGNYVVMPTTFEPNEEGDFILRLFSERKGDKLKVLDHETGIHDVHVHEVGGNTHEHRANMEAAKQSWIDLVGHHAELDAYELRDILNDVIPKQDFTHYKTEGFNIDMARSMVALEDTHFKGKLGIEDFKNVWTDITYCTKVFKSLDAASHGYFNTYELRNALNTLGFCLSNATFSALAIRHGDNEGRINFDDFLICFLKLKTTFAQFNRKDTKGQRRSTFNFEEFMIATMYS